MQAIVGPGDNAGRGKHAFVGQTTDLVLEVTGHHVADFAQRIGKILSDFFYWQAKHLGGHQHSRCLVTTHGDDTAELPC